MSKSNNKPNNNPNPFHTPKADELWERLDKNGKRISKEELLKRIQKLKSGDKD
jgi:hypothetical protein